MAFTARSADSASPLLANSTTSASCCGGKLRV
jgi:hypothetical protein